MLLEDIFTREIHRDTRSSFSRRENSKHGYKNQNESIAVDGDGFFERRIVAKFSIYTILYDWVEDGVEMMKFVIVNFCINISYIRENWYRLIICIIIPKVNIMMEYFYFTSLISVDREYLCEYVIFHKYVNIINKYISYILSDISSASDERNVHQHNDSEIAIRYWNIVPINHIK